MRKECVMRKRLSKVGPLAQLVVALGALTVLGSGSAPGLVGPLRAGDAKGNHGFETVFVNIDAQAGK